jgi:Cof subfamily protein (haloacid dehalogenase superfamily)
VGRAVNFRLLALDLDGTLLSSDKRISARNRVALEAVRRRGVRVVVVTGRRYPAARRVLAGLGTDLPFVLHNGALIIEGQTVRRCRPLARESARRAIRVGRESGADPVVHRGHSGEGELLVETVAPSNVLLQRYLDMSDPAVVRVPELTGALDDDPIQVMFGGSMHEIEDLGPRLEHALGRDARLERTLYPKQDVGIIDVLNPSVGKAEALAFLRRGWGLRAHETLAIGDNWNDHEMLKQAGLGLVMGNAAPATLQLGLPVLPSNDQDGVAVALERHILND